MKILVIGSGGREYAITWKLSKEKSVKKLFVSPGSDALAQLNKVKIVNAKNYEELALFCSQNQINLCFVGPEQPLCDGIVNVFQKYNIPIFGPDKKAAQLEASKSYAKKFMLKYNIPTAKSKTFDKQQDALEYLKKISAPIVIKADGLASGKGVTVAFNIQEAIEAVHKCFQGNFGKAGYKVLIEEFIDGDEASIFAFTDGKTIVPLVSSQDHKRAFDNDQGPNTGGMGAYSPAPIINNNLTQKIKNELLNNFLKGIQKEKLNYKGILFAGLMVKDGNFKVLEFNVRFGDPETQALMLRLKSSLSEAIHKTVTQDLKNYTFEWHSNHSVCIVLASGGYPYDYEKGFLIQGIEEAEKENCLIFHSGTKLNSKKQFVNQGGRVLSVCSEEKSLNLALQKAYKAINKISWNNFFYRKDIGKKAFKHQ